VQGYAAHYCSLSDPVDPTVVTCSFIASGLRVFDISDVLHPKEVAYYVAPTQPRAENEFMASDFAMSKPAIVPARREVWYSDGATGFSVLRVAAQVWPGSAAGGGGSRAARGGCLPRRAGCPPRGARPGARGGGACGAARARSPPRSRSPAAWGSSPGAGGYQPRAAAAALPAAARARPRARPRRQALVADLRRAPREGPLRGSGLTTDDRPPGAAAALPALGRRPPAPLTPPPADQRAVDRRARGGGEPGAL
jgi:hypothetical protein